MSKPNKVLKKIYLSGPMSHRKNKNYPMFNKVAKELRDVGYFVFNPAEEDKEGETWEDCLKRDLELVVKSDLLVLLPCWKKSKGARLEAYVARKLKIPTYLYKEFNFSNA
jgi:nucleoside 2-deoxyribosyltransferase